MKPTGESIVAAGMAFVAILVVASIFNLPGADMRVTPPPPGTPNAEAIYGPGVAAGVHVALATTPGSGPGTVAGGGPGAVAGRGSGTVARSDPGAARDAAWREGRRVAPAPLGASQGGFVAPNIQLSEAHWQGLEALPLSLELKRKLKLPLELEGLLVDEVSLTTAASGLRAGDVLVVFQGQPVRTLRELQAATRRFQSLKQATLTVYRQGSLFSFNVMADKNLGVAQVETAPMILPGDITPHRYRGACTQCHAIGTTGHIVPDPDGIVLPPGPVLAGAKSPHRERGRCAVCHQIIQQ
ncbi:MAG: PDZ domain-containing protein [Magnetococcales bacterium]|nr:PDZ domain-containing protein [Magnetococcales bacterium]